LEVKKLMDVPLRSSSTGWARVMTLKSEDRQAYSQWTLKMNLISWDMWKS
jgi:hypothetical protein